MIIPKETLSKWWGLKERGDVLVLSKKTGLSRATIYNIFKYGECTTSVAFKFQSFFNKKQKGVKQFETQDQN